MEGIERGILEEYNLNNKDKIGIVGNVMELKEI